MIADNNNNLDIPAEFEDMVSSWKKASEDIAGLERQLSQARLDNLIRSAEHNFHNHATLKEQLDCIRRTQKEQSAIIDLEYQISMVKARLTALDMRISFVVANRSREGAREATLTAARAAVEHKPIEPIYSTD